MSQLKFLFILFVIRERESVCNLCYTLFRGQRAAVYVCVCSHVQINVF